MSDNDRFVVKHPDGWAVTGPGHARPSSVHPTQAAAMAAARLIIQNQGGGEMQVQGEDGKWRLKDTIAPAKDPFPPKG